MNEIFKFCVCLFLVIYVAVTAVLICNTVEDKNRTCVNCKCVQTLERMKEAL